MKRNIRNIRPFLSMLVFLSISVSLKAQSVKTLFNVIPNAEQVLTPTERSMYTAISEEDTKEKALIEITELVNVLA